MDEPCFVRIDHERLAALASDYAASVGPAPPALFDDSPIDADQALLVMALDAINFGSGYHDIVRKDPGRSGARTMAARLRGYVAATGPLSSHRLRNVTTRDCSQIFGQELDRGALEELMTRFAMAFNDLGTWLDDQHDGSAATAIERADRSAVRLAESLTAMPFYRDVETVELTTGPLQVSFYKRAQITAADLERECGPGRFDDLTRLTAFADNLVPHVLRVDGVLQYEPELAATIDRRIRLDPGSRAEVEIRAAGVVAVEQLAAITGLRPMDLDLMLWERGGAPSVKARPRHRARGVFY